MSDFTTNNKGEHMTCIKSVRYGYIAGKLPLDKRLQWKGKEGDAYLELKGIVWDSPIQLKNPQKVKVTIQILKR